MSFILFSSRLLCLLSFLPRLYWFLFSSFLWFCFIFCYFIHFNIFFLFFPLNCFPSSFLPLFSFVVCSFFITSFRSSFFSFFLFHVHSSPMFFLVIYYPHFSMNLFSLAFLFFFHYSISFFYRFLFRLIFILRLCFFLPSSVFLNFPLIFSHLHISFHRLLSPFLSHYFSFSSVYPAMSVFLFLPTTSFSSSPCQPFFPSSLPSFCSLSRPFSRISVSFPFSCLITFPIRLSVLPFQFSSFSLAPPYSLRLPVNLPFLPLLCHLFPFFPSLFPSPLSPALSRT